MVTRADLDPIAAALCEQVQKDEALYGRSDKDADSLWDHLERVSKLAEQLGKSEGVDPFHCRLAGWFHDAGKFAGGRYHADDRPEEELSIECLRKLCGEHGLDGDVIERVADAILQLYRDDPEPSPLAQVLFDADNLEKLGPLGVANYFAKVGLRGGGVSPKTLHRLTVELTYARYAPQCMLTESGRELARRRASTTIRFIKDLIQTLRDDGLYDFREEEVDFNGLMLDVVSPASCRCGGELGRDIWEEPGLKCREIHLKHTCEACGETHRLRFCRPRLPS
jgi:uncharacterized protein